MCYLLASIIDSSDSKHLLNRCLGTSCFRLTFRLMKNASTQVNGIESVAGVQGRIGMLQAFQQVIRREGVKALWKGNGVTIVHRLPYSAVNFWAYEQATQLWLQVQ